MTGTLTPGLGSVADECLSGGQGSHGQSVVVVMPQHVHGCPHHGLCWIRRRQFQRFSGRFDDVPMYAEWLDSNTAHNQHHFNTKF